MILAWALWPLILIVAIFGVALRRLLSYWRTLVKWAVVSFVASFIALIIMTYTGPDKPVPNTNTTDLAFASRWWFRLGDLGVTRLLSSGWTQTHYVDPYDYAISNHQARNAYLHVAFGASLTVTMALVLVLFVISVVQAVDRKTAPFGGDQR